MTAGADSITIAGKTIKVFAEKDPAKLPWGSVGAQVVVESTGRFTDATDAKKHLRDSVKKVIISAPRQERRHHPGAGRESRQIRRRQASHRLQRIVYHQLPGSIGKVVNDEFKIVSGTMTTIHSYTNDQVILDFPHKDLRRARAAAINMIPTSTGAAKALKLVFRISGENSMAFPCACRHPTFRWSTWWLG